MSGHDDKSGHIIGIDLGMTSVIMAYVAESGLPPSVIPAERNLPALASVVAFHEDGSPVVGRAARDMVTTAPTRTVTGIKRLLGRKARSQAVKDLVARVGFTIVEGVNGGVVVELGARRIRVAEIAGILLREARSFAEAHLKKTVKECVIAVPAYFNEVQKAAVREAGEIAGFAVRRLVHEPTAVALAYGYDKAAFDARIVIIDMGGVRLDVSIIEISGNVFDVVATGGEPYLGGANMDARIAEWILSNIQRRHRTDLTSEPHLLQNVLTAAEQAKRELCRCKAVDIRIPLDQKGPKSKIATLRLHVSTLEDLSKEVADRVIGTVRKTLSERGLNPSDIDDVIMVGGATRLPLLRRKVEAFFTKSARTNLPPEEVVSLGAALLGDSIRRDKGTTTRSAQPSIGIALADGRLMRIIDRDSRLPITRRVMIPTVRDNQQTLEVDLFEGEVEDIIEGMYLGTIVYTHIAEGRAGEAKIVIDMTLDTDHSVTIASPEPGREHETFTFTTQGPAGNSQKDHSAKPTFRIAKGRPLP